MFARMWGCIKPSTNRPKAESPAKPQCYIAVAQPVYGKDFDITGLLAGHFDENFKNTLGFMDYCGRKLFDNEFAAINDACYRSVMKNSSYIIGLDCFAEDVADIAKKGQLSRHIILAKNARTQERLDLSKLNLANTRPPTPTPNTP